MCPLVSPFPPVRMLTIQEALNEGLIEKLSEVTKTCEIFYF
jgi:hypothetical protein